MSATAELKNLFTDASSRELLDDSDGSQDEPNIEVLIVESEGEKHTESRDCFAERTSDDKRCLEGLRILALNRFRNTFSSHEAGNTEVDQSEKSEKDNEKRSVAKKRSIGSRGENLRSVVIDCRKEKKLRHEENSPYQKENEVKLSDIGFLHR